MLVVVTHKVTVTMRSYNTKRSGAMSPDHVDVAVQSSQVKSVFIDKAKVIQ